VDAGGKSPGSSAPDNKPSASSTARSSSTSSLRSPRFAATQLSPSTTPPRPRRTKKGSGGVTWLHDHPRGSANEEKCYHRERLDSGSSSSSCSCSCSSIDAACGKKNSSGCATYNSDDESDTCTTDTSHTTSTATAHNRAGGGSAEWNWLQQVRATESALDQALRRPAASGAERFVCDVPHYCTLLGNLHFRRGGGGGGTGQQSSPASSSYQLAESYYLRAIQRCERFHRVSHGNNNGALASRSHLIMADARANLGAVMWTTGRVDVAVTTLQQALESYDRYSQLAKVASLDRGDDGSNVPSRQSDAVPSPNLDLRVANVWHQLGLARCLQGRHTEALVCLQCALRLRQRRVAILNDAMVPSDSVTTSGAATATATASTAAAAAAAVEVASTYDAMGKVLACQGEQQAALLHRQQAVEIFLPHAPRRAASAIETIVRPCVQPRNGRSGDALTAAPAFPISSSSTALPCHDVVDNDSYDAIKRVKSWLDGLWWCLLPPPKVESAVTSVGWGTDGDDVATIRREVRGATVVLARQLGPDEQAT
jgi:tetratricopeptide (TPR) repeat protein